MAWAPLSFQHFFNRVMNRIINMVVENNLFGTNKKRRPRASLICLGSNVNVKLLYFRPPQVPLIFLHCV